MSEVMTYNPMEDADVVYGVLLTMRGATFDDIRSTFAEGKLHNIVMLRKVLKYLCDNGQVIRRKKEGIERHYAVETLPDSIEAKVRKVGQNVMDDFKTKLLGREWPEIKTAEILQIYQPNTISSDLTYNSLRRSTNWQITSYEPDKLVTAHGERAGDVELDLMVLNAREREHYDELGLEGKFKRAPKESMRVTRDRVEKYLEWIVKSLERNIERTSELNTVALRLLMYAQGNVGMALDYAEKIYQRTEIHNLPLPVRSVAANPVFSRLRSTRKDDTQKRREFVDYVERRIRGIKI